MRLKIITEDAYEGEIPFLLKDGRSAVAVVEKYSYTRPPLIMAYEVLVFVDGNRVGDFKLGFYDEGGEQVAQMDAHVKKDYRRLGIATGVYDICDDIAASYGFKIVAAPDGTDDGKLFWKARIRHEDFMYL